MPPITVTPIPAFNDNYLWLIENETECWVVDPGDGAAVKKALEVKQRALTGILVTHHHQDHVGGIALLRTENMPVIGPAISPHPLVNDPVEHQETRTICGLLFTIFHVPGHTLNHVAYYAQYDSSQGQQASLLFSGDTLFSAGCGRLFEGTPEQMNKSLKLLAALPDETKVYCAHEYTLANLEFALGVEPDNEELNRYYAATKNARKNGLPSLPSNIALERKINPFLRTEKASIIHFVHSINPNITRHSDSIFTEIRRMKDIA